MGLARNVILGVSEKVSMSLYAFWLGTVTENDERGSMKLLAEAD